MASKNGGKKGVGRRGPGSFGLPLGSALDVAEGAAGLLGRYLAQRYEVERRVQQLKDETAEKVEEIRAEAVRTGYELKKALFRTIVEAILLVTGMVALIVGAIMVVGDIVDIKYVLVGYGFVVTMVVLFQLKTAPEPQ